MGWYQCVLGGFQRLLYGGILSLGSFNAFIKEVEKVNGTLIKFTDMK